MNKIDIEAVVRTFYGFQALEILAKENYVAFLPSHEKWLGDFRAYSSIFEKNLATIIYDYIVKVVASELRHCRLKSELYIPDFYGSTQVGELRRNEIWEDCKKYNPSDIIKAGLLLFDEEMNCWSEGYGGEAWRQIAKGGEYYQKVSDRIFIDHAVDLSHNNSIFFDKGADILILNDVDRYCYYLNLKKVESPEIVLGESIKMSSKELLDFYLRGVNIGLIKIDQFVENANFHRYLKPSFLKKKRDKEFDNLTNYAPVKWGNKSINLNNLKYGWSSDKCTDSDYVNREEWAF